jgi:hypothetical protein
MARIYSDFGLRKYIGPIFKRASEGLDMNGQLGVVLLLLSASPQPSQAAEYLYPGVYLQDGPAPKRIDGVQTSVGGARIVRSCGQKCLPKQLHTRTGKP